MVWMLFERVFSCNVKLICFVLGFFYLSKCETESKHALSSRHGRPGRRLETLWVPTRYEVHVWKMCHLWQLATPATTWGGAGGGAQLWDDMKWEILEMLAILRPKNQWGYIQDLIWLNVYTWQPRWQVYVRLAKSRPNKNTFRRWLDWTGLCRHI